MYVEAFHHVLKYIYLNGKVNKRVDKCIHTLLKITRDKTFERLIKMTKGKKTKKITEIHKRHLASHEMTMESVIPIQEGLWEVKSSRNERKYMVALENLVCPEKCMLKCNECDICIHSFACTCQDYVVNGNMCKHIHLIVKFRTDKYINKTQQGYVHNRTTELTQLHEAVKSDFAGSDVMEIREQVITKLQRITTLIEQCTDKETLQVVNGQLNTTIGLVKCHSKQYKPVLPQINNCEPSNKTIKPQRPFFSTRKRRKTATIRVAKPTTLEKELTESRLRSDNLIYTVKKSAYGKCKYYK